MVTAVCLLTCVLAPSQAAGGLDLLTGPRLARGQELVYAGSFIEEAAGRGVQFTRRYRVESRILVLDSQGPQTELAVLTSLKLRPFTTPGPGASDSSFVRLEFARLSPQGKVTLPTGGAVGVPIQGPSTLECGVFVELPHGRVGVGRTWEVAQEGQPPRSWRVVGSEMINGSRCLKIVGVQQSEDWDRPRADRTGWQRRDTLWVGLGTGVAYRVERIIERREPARRDPTERSVTNYTLESQVVFPRPLLEDRRRELFQFFALADAAAPLLHEPERSGRQSIEALTARITSHIENHPATPYREAILQLKHRLEAAQRGDLVPVEASEDASPVAPVAALGHPAPDFLVSDLTTRDSVRLRRLLGQPILLVFFSPTSKSCPEILRFAQDLCEKPPGGIRVLGLDVSNDAKSVAHQRQDLKLTFPIAAGQGLRVSYGVDATPKLVLLDSAGIVRGGYVGWGPETPQLIAEELKRCSKITPAAPEGVGKTKVSTKESPVGQFGQQEP
jgi:peroxiredoxin